MAEGYAFLKLEGIEGEAQDADYADHIAVQSWSQSVSNNASFGAGSTGGGVGRAVHGDMSFTKYIDKATVNLCKFCTTGKHVDKATLTVLKQSGDTKIPFYTVEMTDCMITAHNLNGTGSGDLPMEHLAIAFAEIKYSYQPQANTGDASGNVDFGWNLQKAKAS